MYEELELKGGGGVGNFLAKVSKNKAVVIVNGITFDLVLCMGVTFMSPGWPSCKKTLHINRFLQSLSLALSLFVRCCYWTSALCCCLYCCFPALPLHRQKKSRINLPSSVWLELDLEVLSIMYLACYTRSFTHSNLLFTVYMCYFGACYKLCISEYVLTYTSFVFCFFAGLQLGYFLEKAGRDYVIFERNTSAGED